MTTGFSFVREDWAGEQVRLPERDLRRLLGYLGDSPEERTAADVLASVVERSDEVRTWRLADIGERELTGALDAMSEAGGLTTLLEHAQRLLRD